MARLTLPGDQAFPEGALARREPVDEGREMIVESPTAVGE
jgi:hypothetical protein